MVPRLWLAFLLLALQWIVTAAATATIALVAGKGIDGFSGDGGPATSAELHTPTGVSLDAGGNVYVSDTSNNRIRKVTVATGMVSTIAGTGSQGSGGDGGLAALATFNQPFGVAIQGESFLYLSDFYNNRVRVVDLRTGTVSALAGNGTSSSSGTSANGDGGAATAASLSLPTGLVYYSSSLYLSDSGNNKVRKVSLLSGIITTTAGTGAGSSDSTSSNGDGGAATAASLSFPTGLAVDSKGSFLYICDMGNQKIRRVSLASGAISLLAGTGRGSSSGTSDNGDGGPALLATFSDPYDVALHLDGLFVYVADYNNHKVRRIDTRTGVIDTAAGLGSTPNLPYTSSNGDGGPATAAALSQPSGLAKNDSSYSLYIVDSGASKVRVAYLPDYAAPTSQPSGQPSRQPSSQPSDQPSRQPSSQPSQRPQAPFTLPTGGPTASPRSSPGAPAPPQQQVSDAVLYGCAAVGALALLIAAALAVSRHRLHKLLRARVHEDSTSSERGGKKSRGGAAPPSGAIDGVRYDQILKVKLELPTGRVALRLGINGGEEPLDAAERFVDAHGLPQEHVRDLAAWISAVAARRAGEPLRPSVGAEGARPPAARKVRRVAPDLEQGAQQQQQRGARRVARAAVRTRVAESDEEEEEEEVVAPEEVAAPEVVAIAGSVCL